MILRPWIMAQVQQEQVLKERDTERRSADSSDCRDEVVAQGSHFLEKKQYLTILHQ